jgi:hypothetical protein
MVPYGTDVTSLVPNITHTGVRIDPASGVTQNFTGSVIYTVTAEDGSTAVYTVTVTIASASDKKITGFSFTSPPATGVVDEEAKTIAVTVPYSTVVTSLVPNITPTGVRIDPASGVAQNFTGPVIYTVTAADGSTQTYTVTVTANGPLTGLSDIAAYLAAAPAPVSLPVRLTLQASGRLSLPR